jgi:hypothetical protein
MIIDREDRKYRNIRKFMLAAIAASIAVFAAFPIFCATPIYRSVGPGNTSALAAGTGTFMITGNNAVFAAAMPPNVGVGDAIQYDSNNDTVIDSIAFITSRIDASHYTVQNAAGGIPTPMMAANQAWAIYRAYTSLRSARVGLENNGINTAVRGFETWSNGRAAVANNEQWNFACYADAADTETTDFVWTAWTTGPNNYIRIYAPYLPDEVGVSQRHNGTYTTSGYRLEDTNGNCLILQNDYIRVEGIQFRVLGASSADTNALWIENTGASSDFRISDCIFWGITTTAYGACDGIEVIAGTGGTVRIWNNIFYNFTQPSSAAIDMNDSAFTFYVYSNTAAYCNTGIGAVSGNVTAINNLVQNCTTANFSGPSFGAGSGYNASSMLDAPGLNSRQGAIALFVNSGLNDFHLASGDTAAIGYGFSLSGDANNPFNDDVDRQVRTGTWDIGADQYNILTAATPTPAATPLPNAGQHWYAANYCAAMGPMYGANAYVLFNKMWVAGYWDGSFPSNLVYSSTDGYNWNFEYGAAWPARYNSGTVVFNGKVYMIGGEGLFGLTSDVWLNVDGVNWGLVTAAPGFSARTGCRVLVFNGNLWVIGGQDASGDLQDAWYSADGVSWNKATDTAAWGKRNGEAAAVFNGYMWVIGGYSDVDLNYEQDAWYSSDGTTWTPATTSAAFSRRSPGGALVYGNRMYITGGWNGIGALGDVWSTGDGSLWAPDTAAAEFGPRKGQADLIFNNQMWVIGGGNGILTAGCDVWYSPPAGTVTPVPTLTPSYTPIMTFTATLTSTPGVTPVLLVSINKSTGGCVNCGGNITYNINYTFRQKPAASIPGAIYSLPATKLVGPGQAYTTIGAALAAAMPDDIIEVEDSGVYSEQITFHDPGDNNIIILRAKPGARPVISFPDGADPNSQVVSMDRNCAISGFRIDGRRIVTDGINNFSASGYTIDRCEIYNCTYNGLLFQNAGSQAYSSYSPIYVTNCIFRDNRSDLNNWGFGIWVMGYTARPGFSIKIWNTDFYNNYQAFTDGSGTGTGYEIRNCIFWGNTNIPGYTKSNVSYSIVEEPAAGYGPGCRNFDPAFVNPQAGNFYLQAISQAIDSGDSTGMLSQAPYDMDFVPRPQGAGWDMGAYEYQPADCGLAAAGVSIWDTIPGGMNFVSASLGYSLNGSVVSWPNPSLCYNDCSNSRQLVLNAAAACPVFTPVSYIDRAEANYTQNLTPVPANPEPAGICTVLPTPSQSFCEVTGTAVNDPINGAGGVVFNGSMWLIAGSWGGTESGDVWNSSDGITWSKKAASAFPGRGYCGTAVLNGSIYMIGGDTGSGYLNDVWASSDGQTWVEKTANAGFSKRFGLQALSYNNKLWVIGGYDGAERNDVWYSTDGASWTQQPAVTVFSGREGHTAIVMNGLMWVIGGYDGTDQLNDVWSSADGGIWTQVSGAAPFEGRYYQAGVVYGGQMYVIGGNDGGAELSDMWRSTDGINWEETSASLEFPARDSMAAFVYNGKIWITGGSASIAYNDVWDMCTGLAPADTATQTPTPSMSATPSGTPTFTIASSATASVSPTRTYTNTPTGSVSSTPTFSATPSFTPTLTTTLTPTPTYTVTDTISSNTPTATSTFTGSPTVTPTFTMTSAFTVTATPTFSATPTFTFTCTGTSSNTATFTFTPTGSMTNTSTYTFTPTGSVSNTPTYTFTPTNSVSNTATYTFTPTGSVSDTGTYTPTPVDTWTNTATFTFTMTGTITDTATATPTITDTSTPLPSATGTPTGTETGTFTNTMTASPTLTVTGTGTLSDTPTFTITSTWTASPPFTPTITPTWTITQTFTNSPTPNIDKALDKNYADASKGEVINIRINASVPNVDVKVKVYDLSGEIIRHLGFTAPIAGWNEYPWDLTNDAGKTVGRGIYFVYIEAEGRNAIRRVYILK